ncbi:MAG: hypothetical protein ACM3N4_01195, partial [Nitrososphaerota archaeon]
PLAVGIALLRHRLFDVDVLINRTLVYGSLTVVLAMIYFITVVVLGVVLSGITRAPTQGSQVAITASTLLIAGLFQPLRSKVQRGINRRFYRSSYDAALTLEAFAAKLSSLVNIEQLSDGVLGVVEETMRPTFATLWLLDPSRAPDASPAAPSGSPPYTDHADQGAPDTGARSSSPQLQ